MNKSRQDVYEFRKYGNRVRARRIIAGAATLNIHIAYPGRVYAIPRTWIAERI